MKNKTQLSVRPVRKSKKPGYPSWQEPNPLEQPYAQPYPFTQKAINWLAASGLCGALFLMPEAEGVAKEVNRIESVGLDTLGNPFPFEKMGLPHVTSPYGTGLPLRLKAENARRMIDSLFLANGYKLEKKVIETGDGLLEVDGYDEEHKIGYVFLPAYRLESDLYLSWQDYNWETKKPFKHLRFDEKILEESRYSIQYLFYRHESYDKSKKDQSGFIKMIKELIDKKEYDWKDEYRPIFYEFLLRDMMPAGVYPRLPYKLRQFYDNILAMPSGEARQIELDKAMSVQDAVFLEDDWVLDALIFASKNENYRQRLKEFKTLQSAYISFRKYPDREKYLRETMMHGDSTWEGALRKVEKWLDEYKANIEEISSLQNDADTGKRYVAVISGLDERCLFYPSQKSYEELRERAFQRFMEKNHNADSTDFHFDSNRELMIIDNKFVQEDLVAKLEKQVHDYILWAKQQRGY